MIASPADRRDLRQLGLQLVFGLIWVLALAFMVRHVNAQNGLVLGDWIIDYRQGFVRRGLIGAMLSPLADLANVAAWKLVPVVVMALWAVFLWRFAQLLAGRDKPFWYVLMLLSPAGVAFGIYQIGDVGRKELLHFALLAQFVWLLDRRRLNTAWTVALAALAFAAGLSHEIMVFYAVYFLIAAHWSRQGRTAWLAAGAMVAAFMASVAMVALFARPFDGKAFCASLSFQEGALASLCKGTILWPLQTLSASIDDTLLAISYFHYTPSYLAALLLTFLPMTLWMQRYGAREFRQALWPIAAAALATLPLFLIAVDWGRFIQIHVVSSALVLVLRLPRRASAAKPAGEGRESRGHLFNWRRRRVRIGLALASLGLAFLWQMPLCCENAVYQGPAVKVGEKLGLL